MNRKIFDYSDKIFIIEISEYFSFRVKLIRSPKSNAKIYEYQNIYIKTIYNRNPIQIA